MQYLVCSFRYVNEMTICRIFYTEQEAKDETCRLAKEEVKKRKNFWHWGDPVYYTYIPIGS